MVPSLAWNITFIEAEGSGAGIGVGVGGICIGVCVGLSMVLGGMVVMVGAPDGVAGVSNEHDNARKEMGISSFLNIIEPSRSKDINNKAKPTRLVSLFCQPKTMKNLQSDLILDQCIRV